VTSWCPFGTHVYHVPDAPSDTAADICIPDAVLLLAAGHEGAVNFDIGKESPTGVAHAHPFLPLGECQVSSNHDAPEWCTLRGGPEQSSSIVKVFSTSPKCAQRARAVCVVALFAKHAPWCVEDNISGMSTQTKDLRVVANGDINLVVTRFEQKRKAQRRKLPMVGWFLPTILFECVIHYCFDVAGLIFRTKHADAWRPSWWVWPL